jgi:hypothetical protein
MKTFISLFDHSSKNYVRIGKSDDTNHWERFTSTDKKTWKKTHTFNNMEDAIKSRDEVVDNNYRNLYDLITKK